MCLRVSDNGVGLPAGSTGGNRRSLGLRLVQMLAGQLRGTRGSAHDGGTGFAIPLTQPQHAQQHEEKQPCLRPPILIVEDEAIVAADLAEQAEAAWATRLRQHRHGEEALALARERRPDLVLMDIRLAGAMDGVEAAERIRRDCDVPVIYLTAHSDRATLERAKLHRAVRLYPQAFEEHELETHIEMALYKHQAERKLRESEEWLRVTLGSIGDAVIASDTAGNVTFLNPVAAALTGWTPAEALGQPVSQVFHIINELTHAAGRGPGGARVAREPCRGAGQSHGACHPRWP